MIDLATLDDVDRLTALAIKDIDWPTLLNDPSVVVVCARTDSEIVGVAAGKIKEDDATETDHHVCRARVAADNTSAAS